MTVKCNQFRKWIIRVSFKHKLTFRVATVPLPRYSDTLAQINSQHPNFISQLYWEWPILTAVPSMGN